MFRSVLLGALSGLLLVGSAMAGDQYWLHVRIDSDDPDGDRVRVNVPIELIETLLPMIETEEFGHGRIRVDDTDLDGVELRKLWNAVRDTKDGQFVSVESRHESVSVAKEGGLLKIRVLEHHRRHEDEQGNHIDVQLPIKVVDAMLSGNEDELDLVAGLQALREHGSSILVTGSDDGSDIRIWIDEKAEMD
ncbi:MAG: hypothetical protein KC729_20265 [Candidatus Eisenbacteria bacterium]|uniref:Uncharacterized protein n=1 Tax=Eiseniibacteriota bacterium TaxID=2212470 RepID=A0A956M2T5_UNCEI|nr:hypothetical protein [Candidatus Eisenbacteria bacterium]